MTVLARRRTRTAALAVSALALGLALQPVTAPPAEAGLNCGTPLAVPDCTPPETVITLQPDRVSHTRTAIFEMTTAAPDPDDPHVVFECKLERDIAPAPVLLEGWDDCSVTGETGRSLGRIEYSNLLPGDYVFTARAKDRGTTLPLPGPLPLPPLLPGEPNVEQDPATYSWTISESAPDDTPSGAPDTRIVSAPRGWYRFPYAEVRFRSDARVSEFVCRLNGRVLPETRCSVDPTDPQAGVAQLVRMGARTVDFEVQARDRAGKLDPTPATAHWMLPLNNTVLNKHSQHWKQRRGYGHYRDTYSVTKKQGATISQGVTGAYQLVVVVTRCPKCGKLDVSMGKKKLATIKLKAPQKRPNRLVKVKTWRKPQTGRVTLKVASKGKRVMVEGMGWTRTRP